MCLKSIGIHGTVLFVRNYVNLHRKISLVKIYAAAAALRIALRNDKTIPIASQLHFIYSMHEHILLLNSVPLMNKPTLMNPA